MKTLIILNYQREIPPFMQTIIKYAKDMYEDVYYITPRLKIDNRDTVGFDNVHVIQSTRLLRWMTFCKLFLMLFDGETYEIIKRGLKDGLELKGLVKHCIIYQFCSMKLIWMTKRLLKQCNKSDSDIVLLATWFSVEAYAVSKIKRKRPSIKTASFAHSFEVDPQKGKYVKYSYNESKHTYLDGIYFIADRMRLIYMNELGDISQDVKNKFYLSYLGSTKEDNNLTISSNEIFNICSCSSLVSVKRIDKLIESLKLWKECPIKWTHLGSGPLMGQIIKQVKELKSLNPLVQVDLKGNLKNEDVKRYYAENPVDLFINMSAAEGLPVSIMEAASYGIPILATDVGGTREIVRKENGFLLPGDCTSQMIHDKILSFYRLSQEQKEIYRKNSFNIWQSQFDAQKNIIEFLNKIQK